MSEWKTYVTKPGVAIEVARLELPICGCSHQQRRVGSSLVGLISQESLDAQYIPVEPPAHPHAPCPWCKAELVIGGPSKGDFFVRCPHGCFTGKWFETEEEAWAANDGRPT